MEKIKVVGVAGVARAGKDTMAECLRIALREHSPGTKIEIRSFAKPLKDDLFHFILEKFAIDIFNCSDEEKAFIRPIMVAYGGAQRTRTKGTYWTGLMDKELERLEAQGVDLVIIPDVRYCDWENDEIAWLAKHGGHLMHVSKILEDGTILQPANEDEARNDPKLQNLSDQKIQWPEQSFDACLDLVRELI